MNESVPCQAISVPASPRSWWRRIDCWFSVLTLVGFLSYWVGSEVIYMRRIEPTGIAKVDDYFARFGDPLFVCMVENNGRQCYEFTGPSDRSWIIAVPSALPVYVFDNEGVFVTWCSDPGDLDEYGNTWRRLPGDPIDVATIRQRFNR